MSKVLHIEQYNSKTIIDNDIEEIVIKQLVSPLNNLPPSITKITINHSINTFKRHHKLPYHCQLIIENTRINTINSFSKMEKEDYDDITEIYLTFEKYNFEKIQEYLCNCINLRMLYLRNCDLTTIPECICELTNLTTLYLEDCQITTIPDYICKLKNLMVLSLKYNNITTISKSINELSKLYKIHLYGNHSCIPRPIWLDKRIDLKVTL